MWVIIQYNQGSYKKGKDQHRHTNTGKMPCEDESRDRGDGYIKMKMFYSITDTIKMIKR